MSDKGVLVKQIMGTAMSWQRKLYKQCDLSLTKSQTKLATTDTNLYVEEKKDQKEIYKNIKCLSSGDEITSDFNTNSQYSTIF